MHKCNQAKIFSLINHMVFRENRGRISRCQRSVKGDYEKTDCQHTANGGREEHCRAFRGESDKFFRNADKILQPSPPTPLKG